VAIGLLFKAENGTFFYKAGYKKRNLISKGPSQEEQAFEANHI